MNTHQNLIKCNIYRICFLFLMLGCCSIMNAQEFLTGTKTNTHVAKEYQKYKDRNSKGKSDNEPLLLPFFEDFSNYTGYPNEKLFADRQAYINQTFAVRPISIGVATLDALNEYGEIYPHLSTIPKGADTLTSRCIRLDTLFSADGIRKIIPSDSVYFSFYFQPGGAGLAGSDQPIGNQPNINDSLVLEFGYIPVGDTTFTTVWHHVWATPGFNINTWNPLDTPYQYFKQILIPITDERYLSNSFRFRFRNYASLEPQTGMVGWEGNVDQWHIDYIRLNVNRSRNDIYTNDLTFITPTTSFLKTYQAMPWKQFKREDIISNFNNQLANISKIGRQANYKYTITHKGNIESTYKSGDGIDVLSYFTNGMVTYPDLVSPEISYSPHLTDTATFVITHVFQNSHEPDFCLSNDTCIYEQKFYDYYAYDDGTAEYGYCLNNQYNKAYLAMKFELQTPDSLRGVQMWFNHTKNDENTNAAFDIVIWQDDGTGKPAVKPLYTLTDNKPSFDESQFLDFVEYTFDKKILVSGVIWVGFEQIGNKQLNLGFDQNNDARNFFLYNTAGTWETSAYKGTPMIRPVFGERIKKPNSITHTPALTSVVSPNPATDQIIIRNYETGIISVEIYDLLGRKQSHLSPVTRHENNEVVIDVSHLPKGIYFLKINKTTQTFETVKLIKK